MDYLKIKTQLRNAQYNNDIKTQIIICNKYKNCGLFKILYNNYIPNLHKWNYFEYTKNDYSDIEIDFILAYITSYINVLKYYAVTTDLFLYRLDKRNI